MATINSEGSVTYDTSRFDRISEDTLTDDVDLTDGGTYRKLIEDPDAPDDGEGARNEEGTSPSTQSHSSPNGTKKEKESGILGASFNVINSIVGAGMIGVPAALREAGFVTGVFLLVLVALVTDFTLYILVATGVSINRLSYQEAVKKALGVVGLVLVTIAQFFFPFFAMIGYIVIVGDTITRVISGAFLAFNTDPPSPIGDAWFVKALCVLFIMLPICCLRNIASLEKFSGIAVVLITGLEIAVFYELIVLFCPVRCFDLNIQNSSVSWNQPSCCVGTEPLNIFADWVINLEVFSAIGVIAFAYVCHHNIFLIYNSLKNRTMKRFLITINISVGVSFIFLTCLGALGYLTFIRNTQGDLLNNYCDTDPVADIARILYALVIMLTYPIECCVTREVLEITLSKVPRLWVLRIKNLRVREAVESFLYTPLRGSLVRHFVLTFLLVGGTAVVGIPVEDLESVLAISGCLTATPIAFIFPPLVFLVLTKEKGVTWKKVLSFLILAMGTLVFFIGTGTAIYRAVINSKEEITMYFCPDRLHRPNIDFCPIPQLRNDTIFSTSPLGCDCEGIYRRTLKYNDTTFLCSGY